MATAETCDRCGARATHRAINHVGATLTFCDHCTRAQGDALRAGGWSLVDLAKVPAPTA